MDLVFNVPVNRVSFGQVSYNLLKAAKSLGHNVFLVPIAQIDLGTLNVTPEFHKWLTEACIRGVEGVQRDMRGIKLWHLVTPDGENNSVRGSYDKICDNTSFVSFYELDSPTPVELNVARQHDTIFTSSYTAEVFSQKGVQTRFVPLGFDKENFFATNKRYFQDDRIAFALLGKFENRKHHQKVIRAWVKRFGNDKRYYLQCAVFNPFFNPQMNANLVAGSFDGKNYWNVNALPWIEKNLAYNDFLNSNHIVIGMSGGEGWGLPEFHTVGIGKHAVILNAHAYKDWATSENAVLVNPLNKMSAIDNFFFREGMPYNQGNIFNWDEDEFIAGCEEAIERYRTNSVNTAGLRLQETFTYEKTLQAILNNK